VRRLLQAALVVVGVVTLVFFLIRVSGDPASLGVSLEENRTQEEIEAEYRRVQKQLGLDRHILIQYVLFWGRAARGDFGFSFRYSIPATQLIIDRLPNSLRLGALAAIIGLVVGLPLGIVAALNRGSIIDNLATGVSVFGFVVPQFWLAIVLIIIFSVHLGWLPTSGTGSWKHIILPAFTLSLGLVATVARMSRSGMLEALSQDYVRTARAKGLSERLVIFRHALRNGSISVITVVVSSLPHLLGTVVVVEVVFAWPGVGNLMAQAVNNRDYPVVFLDVLLFGTLTVLVFLIMDLLYAAVDPRIRHR
jgi:peptide/nickel transport system permease protein